MGKAREGRTVRVTGGGSRYPAESHLTYAARYGGLPV